MKNVENTLISQYANSPTINSLIQSFNVTVDPSADFNNFFSVVWNIATARGFGLDIWGRIVGLSRTITVSRAIDYFGFKQAGDKAGTFNFFPFYGGSGGNATKTNNLNDSTYRKFILIKALKNISKPTNRTINSILQKIFQGRGKCYTKDIGNMEIQIFFEFELSPMDYAIIEQLDLIPRPAGVLMTIRVIGQKFFGFKESGSRALTFGHGPFYE